MEILTINGKDYAPYIVRKGYGWSREDLDSEQTKRTKDGTLRRQKIGTKRKLSYQLMNMTRSELAGLDDALSAATFSATYLDLHGVMTKTFYCSSFSATLSDMLDGGHEVWADASFHLIEV